MTKVILFNGPPRSGKDTCAGIAWDSLYSADIYSFAEPLKNAVHAMYGLDVDSYHFENYKDEPNELLLGFTPREAYISLSEDYIKPRFGKDFFGKSAVNFLKSYTCSSSPLVVISDCGFTEEIQPLVDYLGKDNISIIQVYRPGHDFSNDSRSYVDIPGIKTYKIHNDGTLEELENNLKKLLEIILEN